MIGMKKIFIITAMLSMACAWRAVAQQPRSVETVQAGMTRMSGRVCDAATGKPLAGATVKVEGDNRYTSMTDENGEFTVQVPSYVSSLSCSAPTYQEQRLSVKTTGPLVVRLYSEAFNHDMRPAGSLTVEDELAKLNDGSVRVLAHSGNPAVGAALFLGGYNSINANAQPLVVVDGVILDRQLSRTLVHDGYFNNVLSAISVNDIESVHLLKNGTALYGAQGANGVIVIQTKRSRTMATRIDVDVWAGIERQPQAMPMLNSGQYRLYASDINGNSVSLPDFLDEFTANPQKYATYHNNTDWTKQVYREAVTQNYNVNVRGGDNVALYNLSIGYVNAQSTLKNNDFSRLNLRFNTDVNIIKPLEAHIDVAYSNTTRNLRDDGMRRSDILAPSALALIKSPLLNPYSADNNGRTTSTLADADNFGLSNPLSILENGDASNKNRLEYSLFTLSAMPVWTISKNWKVSERVSYALNNVTERSFTPDEGVASISNTSGTDTQNQSKANSYKQTSLQSDTRLTWDGRFGGHSLTVFGGFRYMSDSFNADAIKADNSAGDKMPNITSSMDNRTVSGTVETWKSTTAYINADWNYAQKYFVQLAASAATSTRFGENADGAFKIGKYVWGFFPSVQASWNIASEGFMRSVRFVDGLMVSLGYDVSGNDDIDSYASRTYFVATPFLNQTSGLALAGIGNDQLKWETTHRLTAGFETMVFNNRLHLAFHYFLSRTDNLLVWKSLSGVGGIASYLSNDGKMKNQGFDLSLNVKVLALKDFAWDISASMGHYKNEVTQLPDGDSQMLSEYYDGTILTQKGSPLGLFYGYKTEGVFATSEEASAASLHNGTASGNLFAAGDMRFADLNGDHIIDSQDRTVIGDPNPDIYGNFGTMVQYRRWRLDATFTYSLGNDLYNYQRSVLEAGSNYYNKTTALLRRWTKEGQTTDVPRATVGDPMGNARFSDRWIEDGSYLKLKTLRLSYHCPLNLSWMQGFTVWAAANNLFTVTRYLGADPEVSSSNSPLYQGIDRGLLGHGRSYVLGLKIEL